MRSKSRWCATCERIRRFELEEPNIGFHVLLSTLTCGLWLPVMLYIIARGKWSCNRCGRST